MVVQWPGFLLDRYVAPKSSALAKCLAPEVPELPDYFGSFFLTTFSQSKILSALFLSQTFSYEGSPMLCKIIEMVAKRCWRVLPQYRARMTWFVLT